MRKIMNGEEITLGVCYYPEHWPESMWENDLDRMLEVGIRVVRIAEFAWSIVEPHENEFCFEFFDKFLDLAWKKGMNVIFCTPTATPPVWLTTKYPEVLNANKNGVIYEHGERRHYNYNSPVYQEKTRIIVEKYASHYAPHPAVIGWQIDNELNCGTDEFYSKSDSAAFRTFLKEKYQFLDKLNEAWGTVFWNQTYTDWEEVKVPGPTPCDNVNCHEMLDYVRFVSDSTRKYAKLHSDIIKKYIKEGDFITTNGRFAKLDNHKMCEESLDFFTYDSYPNFAYVPTFYDASPNSLRDRWSSKNLTEVRSISKNFGIMEQQSGANTLTTPTPKPGQITLWTMQSVAHGADFISYFRWRTCLFGSELSWHGILDHSGRDNRRLKEIKDVFTKLQSIKTVAGSKYEAKVAVLKDYDNEWDTWNKDFSTISDDAIFAVAQKTHTPLDYVYLWDEGTSEVLNKYRVVFYPHGLMMSEKRKKILENYVAQGGNLILGCHSGYRNLYGHGILDKLPGVLRKLTGVDVVEYTPTAPGDEKVYIRWGNDLLEAVSINDQMEILPEAKETARILGNYENCYYQGTAGLIENTFGKGKVYYWGAVFTEAVTKTFLEKMHVISPYEDILSLPEECELAVRVKENEKYYFVLNYKKEPVTVKLKKTLKNMYTSERISGQVQLAAYETMILGEENL